MALYLGTKRKKVNIENMKYTFEYFKKSLIKLLSSDGYVLKSSDGLKLVLKEE